MRTPHATCARALAAAAIIAILAGGRGAGTLAVVAATHRAPDLSGTWALEGTGPAGLVASGGRIATVQLQQHGSRLAVTLRSGGRRYSGAGTAAWPARVAFNWQMPAAGRVRFTGTLQPGDARILGQWSDAHGDDGGALLVRVSR